MTHKIPTTFYEQFLEEDTNSFSTTREYISGREQFVNFSQATLIRFGALTFTHPFQSIRLLRQVQCGNTVDTVDKAGFCKKPAMSEKEESEMEANLMHSYQIFNTPFKTASVAEMEMLVNNPSPVEKDELGYVQSESNLSPKLISKWPIFLNKQCSLWSTARLIATNQGISSLWNGLFASWLYDFCSESLYIGLDGIVATRVKALDSFNLASTLLRGLINFALTPFDLMRTRMITLSIFPSERRSTNVFAGLYQVFRNEGGVSALFPNKLFSLMYSFIPPILKHLPLMLLSSVAENVAESYNIPAGIAFATIQLIITCAEAVVLSPLETIRRRLFLQSKTPGFWIYRVPIAEQPYTGFWNALRRIYQEEGFGALYQGLSINLASALVNFTSTAIMTLETEYADDMEAF